MKHLAFALTALLSLAALNNTAAAKGSDFQVAATILASCSTAGTSLSFGGSIDPLATTGPVDASTTLSVICTNTTAYSVGLSAGVNAGGSNTAARTLKNGNNALPYQLFQDPSHSKVWGEGSSGYSGIGTGNSQALTIYGRLPSVAGVAPGNYSDTVMVTISY